MKNNSELLNLCLEDKIPIVRNKTKDFICNIIKKNNYRSLLEIGTAYGYSTSIWAQIPTLLSIVTIEKNEEAYKIAKKYLNNEKIELHNCDAFSFIPNKKFDVIFIDGPKSKQEQLVLHYINFLNANGTMIIDNLFLKKFDNYNKLNKNQLKLVKKISNFRSWLQNEMKDYNFKLYDIDDGIGVLTKNA